MKNLYTELERLSAAPGFHVGSFWSSDPGSHCRVVLMSAVLSIHLRCYYDRSSCIQLSSALPPIFQLRHYFHNRIFVMTGFLCHSSILAWRIPWTAEHGRLQSIGLQSQTRLKSLSTRACLVPLSFLSNKHQII